MRSMNEFGNDLYSGKTSFPFVGKRRIWFIIAILLVVGSALVPLFRPVQFSIEFTGGSQFTVEAPANRDQGLATTAVRSVLPNVTTKVTTVNNRDIRVQTAQLKSEQQSHDVAAALAKAYGVAEDKVNTSFIGPSWGEGVTRQSLWGLAIFLALIFAATKPLGIFMAHVFNRERTFLDPVLRPLERLIYKLTGGKVYDPANKVSGEVPDIYVQNGRIIAARPKA